MPRFEPLTEAEQELHDEFMARDEYEPDLDSGISDDNWACGTLDPNT